MPAVDANNAAQNAASTSTPQKEGKEKKEKPKSKTAQQVISLCLDVFEL